MQGHRMRRWWPNRLHRRRRTRGPGRTIQPQMQFRPCSVAGASAREAVVGRSHEQHGGNRGQERDGEQRVDVLTRAFWFGPSRDGGLFFSVVNPRGTAQGEGGDADCVRCPVDIAHHRPAAVAAFVRMLNWFRRWGTAAQVRATVEPHLRWSTRTPERLVFVSSTEGSEGDCDRRGRVTIAVEGAAL